MRALKFLLTVWVLSFMSYQESFANINFSHRNSTINVGSGKLIVNAPISNWSGTLIQTGAVTGQPIGFNLGILETSGTPALFTGSYDNDVSPQIVLTQNQSIRIDSGQFAKNILATRGGNRLEGQPVFTQGSAITLGNALADLTLALNGPVATSITMNGGKIILDGDVNLTDDNRVTGSGTINVNGRRFMFGGPLTSSSLKLTHTLLWNNASAVELNGPLSLYGAWTFQSPIAGNQPCILGNGNILDLTGRGSIFVPRNTTLYLVDLKIKGLGRGGFVLQDKTSQVRCSGVEFEMANSYTFTTGGMFFDKTSTVITKAGLLTFSLLSSLTVDGVTLFYDPVNTPDIFNIRPRIADSVNNHGNVTYVNSGIIRGIASAGDGDLSRANSNTLLFLERTDSATKLFLTRNNSNTLLFLNRTNSRADARGIRNNSNTLLFLNRTNSRADARGIRNNSNAILNILNPNNTNSLASQIRFVSNTMLYLDRGDSAAKLFLTRNNSKALLFLNRTNSRADARGIRNNSNAILNILASTNTGALASQIKNISNTLLFLDRGDSAAKLFLTRNNSNTLLFLNRTNSRADARGIRNNSNAILRILASTNTGAIASQIKNISNTLLFLDRGDSAAKLFLTRNNSNTLLFLNRTNSRAHARGIRNNSNAILNILNPNNTNSLVSQIKNVSNTLLFLDRGDSAAKLFLTRNNSNTLLFLNRTNSRAHARGIRNNSNAILNILNPNNTNSLVSQIKNISNTLLFLDRGDSAAKLFLTRNNSNTLLFLNRTNSRADARGIRNNSNAILNILNPNNTNSLASQIRFVSNTVLFLDRTDSAAKLFLTRNNSNALLACCRENSNTLLFLTTNNSNAIMNILNPNNTNSLASQIRFVSNTVLFLDRTDSAAKLFLSRNNSNALLYLDRTNSNADARGIRNNSNALLACCRDNSNALLFLTTNNSNAIINILNPNNTNSLASQIRYVSNTILFVDRTDSAAKLYLTRNNSNTLLFLNRNNSNTILDLSQTTSQALIDLSVNNSNTLLFLTRNNSNALLACCRDNSNSLLYLNRNNSNTLLFLSRNNSNSLLACCNNTNSVSSCDCILTQGPITTDKLMTCNCIVHPFETIQINENLTIDGQGAWIEFSAPTNPQFIIAPGKTVTLRNVTLFRINNDTFSFGDGSAMVLGPDVIFELSEDVAIAGNNISISGSPDAPNVFTLRGVGGQKRFQIIPVFRPTAGGPVVVQTFDIGFSTLMLENIEFIGLESVAVSRVDIPNVGVFVGSFALSGESTVDINVDTEMSFFNEGPNNILRFFNDNLTLSGFIDWSQEFDSELHFSFNLGEPLLGNVPPIINVADDAIFLGSAEGRARLIIDDYIVTLNLLGSNSFVTDVHAFIGGRNVEILNFPIKQTSADLILDSSLILLTDLVSAIDPAFARSLHVAHRRKPVIRALDLVRAQRADLVERKRARLQKHYEATHLHPVMVQKPPMPKLTGAKAKKQAQSKPHTRGIDFELLEGGVIDFEGMDFEFMEECPLTRIFDANLVAFTNIYDSTSIKISDAFGIIDLKGDSSTAGIITDFGVHPNLQLSLYMRGNALLEQKTVDALFKNGDTLFVEGQDNVIKVTKNFVFNGGINFNPNSHLIFEFDDKADNPTVIFSSEFNPNLVIPSGTRIEFKGNGTVWFQDGMTISLQSGPIVNGALTDRSVFAVTDSAKMRLSTSVSLPPVVEPVVGTSTVTINGQGKVILDSGATLVVEGDQHLIVGAVTSDDIDWLVDRGSILKASGLKQSDSDLKATISFQFAKYKLTINQASKLMIDFNGIFEINNNNCATSGLLTELNINDGGWIELDHDGEFIMGPNAPDPITQQETPFIFDMVGGDWDGDGIVRFNGTIFAGRLVTPALLKPVSFTAQKFVRFLINRVPALTFSTVFRDADGNLWLFNKDVNLCRTDLYDLATTIFKLQPGDCIQSDMITSNSNGVITGNVFGFNNGISFVILPDSTRV